ncbi:hypothetical protein K437DRAFT_131551 [Tilletiaria anomala UBC 951]|uniref:Uncharacterized protein n=1 Tax=Tilletiaria anomala (strain ATCC 24038 / CBS 436.72 / UBC 951) TaxID=1037660 RepID=A0A066WPJ4_TILAU|nr:uncharacterized protein K437DRAFT_131551 [Tilletiaria anomala UBC 951]KDN52904.1 hypothetical protein K437DRAFT_131551 [Tilletiaria anomala UBC 951]
MSDIGSSSTVSNSLGSPTKRNEPAGSTSNRPTGAASTTAAAGASLSERIAALQRANITPDSSPRLPSALGGSSASINGDSSFTSPRAATVARSISASVSGGGSSGGPNAVRDRIARFQATAATEAPLIPRSSFGAPAPNPDVLKSSKRLNFPGSLGAGGMGTGNWGETLRPQLTGGSWLQIGGSGASHGREGEMRPQLTGGIWGVKTMPTGRGGAPFPAPAPQQVHPALPPTPPSLNKYGTSPFASAPKILGGGADAFAELDNEAETETARYYRQQREAQAQHRQQRLELGAVALVEEASTGSAAGAKGDAAHVDARDVSPGSGGLDSLKGMRDVVPSFPKTPDAEVNVDAIARDRARSADTGGPSFEKGDVKFPTLPAVPLETPRRPANNGVRLSPSSEIRGARPADASALQGVLGDDGGREDDADRSLRDPLIDVGVQGSTPEKLRQLQARVDSMIDSIDCPAHGPSTSRTVHSEDVFGFIGSNADAVPSKHEAKAVRRHASAIGTGQDEQLQQADASSASSEYSAESAETPSSAGAAVPSSGGSGMPSRQRQLGQGRWAADRAGKHAAMQSNIADAPLYPDADEDENDGARRADASYEGDGMDDDEFTMVSVPSSAGYADEVSSLFSLRLGTTHAVPVSASDSAVTLLHHNHGSTPKSNGIELQQHQQHNGAADRQGRGKASSDTPQSASSASNTPARSKSQKLNRPPVGRMMSAAELDASDDDYEPGWASILTSRTS